jgi:hypothetical protein
LFAKIFSQIYDGTLGGDWKALITFQQMLILSDEDGIIDMTPAAIHRVTGIPFDIIEHGIKKLSEPDPQSRSDTHDGRRIVLLDASRNWGWQVVNKIYYRNLASREDKKRKDRERIAEKRLDKSTVSQHVADSSDVSPKVADVAHTNTNTNTNTSKPISLSSGFDEFYLAYPRKQSKDDAVKAWKKLKPDESLITAILAGLSRAKQSEQWKDNNGKFIPYPASWLNKGGWKDEYTPSAEPQNKQPKAFPKQ